MSKLAQNKITNYFASTTDDDTTKKKKKNITVVCVRAANLRKMGYDNLHQWKNDNPNHVYVGRTLKLANQRVVPGSQWGNPYKVSKNLTSDEVLAKYESYVRRTDFLMNNIHKLEGKTLGCWCRTKKCHAYVLKKLVDELQ